jgi:hypothetical protein
MAKEVKLYIPLKGKKGVTYITANKIKEITDILPPMEDILFNLATQKLSKDKGLDFIPLQVKVTEEEFKKLEIILRKKKAGHTFIHKAFDIIGAADPTVQLVQIIQTK